MGIFSVEGTGSILEQDLQNPNELLEAYIFDEVSRLTDERRAEFVKSEEAQAMVEAGLISKKTLVRLSKVDDLERRISMAAMQMAKDNNDTLFDQLTKNRIKERELLDKIYAKYSMRATNVAKIGQKDYLKNKLPLGFFRK
jgi:hypothetical protein